MILMGVGYDEHVDAPYPPAPQIGRDNVFTRIEVGAPLARAVRENPATIYNHRLAVGKNQEQPIAWADVDGGQFKFPAADVRRPRLPQENRETHQYCGTGRP